MEKPAQSDRICRIKFEDLIYNYDQTVSDIFKKLGWDENIWDLSGEKPVLK